MPSGGDAAIEPQGLDTAIDLKPTLRYDSAHDRFVKISNGQVFRDNGLGSFAAANGDELEPGWKTGTGFRNFGRIIHNPLIRAPFLRVFAWTFVFATMTVLLSFALGLFLAIALDKPGLPFQRLYRSVLIIPYAVPAFLLLLVWAGLLNDDFGAVNHILHAHIPWILGSAWWARVSVIIVSMWLTFPYFFLVSMGALQSIPMELTEAARVDGGGPWQVFRKVTLPLLLVAVAPLMIASFAFNFNNFNNIYLLTGGGPLASDQSIAGATDILISYTYKLAFAAGKGNDYGLASAIAIVDLLHRRDDLDDRRSCARASSRRSTDEYARARRRRHPRRAARRRAAGARRGGIRSDWWRHLVGIFAMVFALFPVVYVVSAAFNADASLTGSSVIPRKVTLHNFKVLFQTHFSATESSYAGAHYVRWFANSIIVAGGDGDPDRAAERARGVCLQPLPLPRAPARDAAAAADPDVPAAPRGGRDLPDRAPGRRGLPVPRARPAG